MRTIQTNSLPPVSRAGTTTTTTSQQLMGSNTAPFHAFGGGGSLRMRLLDRSLEHQQFNKDGTAENDKFLSSNATGSAQVLTSIGESSTDESIAALGKQQKMHQQQQIQVFKKF